MRSRRILEPSQRPLTGAEIRLLKSRLESLRVRGRRAVSAGLWIGLCVIVLLWAVTMFVSDAPAIVITGFWIVVGIVIVWWVGRDLKSDSRTMDEFAAALESAVHRNLAEVYDIRATGFVAFEEVEDEGACYAFQLEGDRLVFLQGQEFYETARFPSLDFSLVCPLDHLGRQVHMFIDNRGPKAEPQRRVPADIKWALEFPEDLEVVDGTLDRVEELLRR